MKNAAIILVASSAMLAACVANAQTLDELQHPLMAKGQVVATGAYEYYGSEHVEGDFLGTFTGTYVRPEYVLVPQLRVGLAKPLELRFDAMNQFPTLFSDPVYAAFRPGRHWTYGTALRSAAGSLVFRPRANVEVRGLYRWGRSEDTLDYSMDPVTDVYDTQPSTTHVVSAGMTWLSAVDRQSRPLRADLDGLDHPLLARRRWRIDTELMRRWYANGYHSSGNPEIVIDDSGQSTDSRLRIAIAHGLTDRLQILADAYWHPAFMMTNTSQVASTWMGRTTVSTTLSTTWYQHVYGWRLDGTWRINPRAEIVVAGTREQQDIADERAPSLGPYVVYRTTTIKIGGSLLSRPPTKSGALAADLPGLFHPFVEPRQLRLDALVDRLGYQGDLFVPEAWLWRVQATTGVWSWMQASAYGGMMSVRRDSIFSVSERLPTRYTSMGAEVKIRMGGRVEAFSSVQLHPADVFNDYPLFILGRNDPYHYYHDVLSNDLGGDRTFHVGLRLVL